MSLREEHHVVGGGGVGIATMASGPERAQALLFVHGWSQSQRCWEPILSGPLSQRYRLVSMDLRGHGRSDRPAETSAYQASALWAQDVAAVIAAYDLVRPILVGWSYGGYVIADYLRTYGEANLGGVCFVGAITQRGTEKTKRYRGAASGPAFKTATTAGADDAHAMRAFLRLCTHEPLAPARLEEHVLQNVLVPQPIRAALFDRGPLDNDDVLAKLTVPVTVIHGAQDRIVLPASAEDHAAVIPGTTLRIYPNVGHMPFEEAPAAFESDLRALAETVGAGASH